MNMINIHALWLAIRGFVFYKFPPNIRAHDNYVGEVLNRRSRTTEVLFGVKICERRLLASGTI